PTTAPPIPAPGTVLDSAASIATTTGGTLATNTAASVLDPIGTSVTVPAGLLAGPVSINESTAPSDPTPAGFTFIGRQVVIEAPAATVANPLRLTFLLDNSLVGMRGNPTVYRNGVAVAPCASRTAAAADPNPCVESIVPADGGDVLINVRTATASRWAFAQPLSPPAPPTIGSVCAAGSPAPTGYALQEGTARDDVLVGTAGPDLLRGLGGNDILIGLEGNDILCGGSGRDLMSGGNGNDLLSGEAGIDVGYGGAGNDLIVGGTGNDFLRGGNDNDRILGDEGDDWLFGDNGNDLLVGGPGNDRISGGLGNDRVIPSARRE
ncbi:MAG: calcium-binding protein, partial [Sporichthyaceae bacterium]